MAFVLETLFYPLMQHLIVPEKECSYAFLNAQYFPYLDKINSSTLFIQQYFKPYAKILQEHDFHVSSRIDIKDKTYDIVLIALPKNALETRYLIAQGLCILKPEGIIICAASNKAGGTRIKKILQDFACIDIQKFSKNKARVVWAKKADVLNKASIDAIANGEPQAILDEEYISMPGIFGWNKIDKGSKILEQYLSGKLKGNGADFGCGYGSLSRYILQNNSNIESLSCIDADYRAIQCCKKNLKNERMTNIHYFCEDLTQPLSGLRNLDFIVMNPPFHEGQKTNINVGISFIKTAVYTLNSGGMLWMVANAELPYEKILAKSFSSYKKEFEGQGFKVFCAVK